MPRVKIQLADNIKRVVTFDSDATVGARLGANLLMPDGKIGTPASVLQWLGGALPSQPSGGGNSGIPVGNYLTTKGDLLTRDTQVQRLPIGTTGQALLVAAGLPAWGVLGVAGGGTSFSSYTIGDMLYASGAASLAKLGIGAAGTIMKSTAGLPQWIAPAALTKTDDTNVTLTLGGSAATALINAASLTLGWTGTLGVARGGTNLASYTAGDLLYATGATTLAKRAIGSTNDVLTVVGGVPTWAAAAGSSPLTTKGDLYGFSTVNARIPVGTNGDVLTADSTQALGVKWATGGGGGGTPANPTAVVGLTAVNGSASTYMRSDAAPPIDQGIVPTWTGQHRFTAIRRMESTAPQEIYNETDAATDEKRWIQYANAGIFHFAILNDIESVIRDYFTIARTGNAVAAMDYGNSTDNPAHTFYGAATFNTPSSATWTVNLASGGALFAAPTSTNARIRVVTAASSGNLADIRFATNNADKAFVGVPLNGGSFFTGGTADAMCLRAEVVMQRGISSTLYETMSGAGAFRWHAYGAGTLTTDASGNITAVSDERAKRKIRPFTRGLAAVLGLETILHGYSKSSGLDQGKSDYAGFRAQNVRKFIPEAVGQDMHGMLTLNINPVLAAAVNAIKELNARIEALEAV